MTNIQLQSAFNNIRRSPFQALAGISVLTVTFFVMSIVAVLIFASSQLLKYAETRPQVIAFLKTDAKEDDIANLHNKLKNDQRLANVNYVTKEQALELYKEKTQKNPLLSELVSASVFPASLEFSLKNLQFADPVINEIKNESIVEDVGFTATIGDDKEVSQEVNKIRNAIDYVKIGGITFAAFLVITSFFVLMLIIGLRMTTRRGEIEILNLIGATSGFIRAPIMMEALTYSILGVTFGWLLALLLVLYVSPSIIAYFEEITVLPKDTLGLLELFGIIFAAEFVAGIILALLGSSVAVKRARRRR